MKPNFFQRRGVHPILKLLRQGVTPEKLALSLALSATLSVIPAFGWSVWLCALGAVIFGLNLPVMQAVNYIMYPAQIALLLPFFRLGEKLFHAPHLPLSMQVIYAKIHSDLWGSVKFLWDTTWHAVVVWALLAPFSVALLYLILVFIFRRVVRRETSPVPLTEVKAA